MVFNGNRSGHVTITSHLRQGISDNRLFVQQLIQAKSMETSKSLIIGYAWGKSTSDRLSTSQKTRNVKRFNITEAKCHTYILRGPYFTSYNFLQINLYRLTINISSKKMISNILSEYIDVAHLYITRILLWVPRIN